MIKGHYTVKEIIRIPRHNIKKTIKYCKMNPELGRTRYTIFLTFYTTIKGPMENNID